MADRYMTLYSKGMKELDRHVSMQQRQTHHLNITYQEAISLLPFTSQTLQ